MADHAPSYRYHPTDAPYGKRFETHAELDELDASWVDTPTKFPKGLEDYQEGTWVPITCEPVKKRGRKRADADRA